MELINYIAGILYNFFYFLGKICSTKLVDVFSGTRVTVGNPFNDIEWIINTNVFGENVDTLGEWILNKLGLADLLVFDGLLFVTATAFVIVFFVRLFSATTPD